MSAWIIWLIAAILLLILEVLSQAVWSLCFAIGCIAAMAISFLTNSAAYQGLTVGIVAILSWIIFAPMIRKWENKRNQGSRTGMDALLDRTGIITKEIKPGGIGRVRIDGDYWQAKAPEATRTINCGEEVRVKAYDSIILSVTTI